jgi:hypothetical protein
MNGWALPVFEPIGPCNRTKVSKRAESSANSTEQKNSTACDRRMGAEIIFNCKKEGVRDKNSRTIAMRQFLTIGKRRHSMQEWIMRNVDSQSC